MAAFKHAWPNVMRPSSEVAGPRAGARMTGDFPWLTTKMDGFNGKTVVFFECNICKQWMVEKLVDYWDTWSHVICDAPWSPWRISMILHCKPRSKQAQRLVTYNACETSQKSFGGGTEAIDLWSPRRDVSYLVGILLKHLKPPVSWNTKLLYRLDESMLWMNIP